MGILIEGVDGFGVVYCICEWMNSKESRLIGPLEERALRPEFDAKV